MESSSASSFRGDDHQQQLHGGEFRLLSLVGKLGHSLSEIRLRALRNLRCKVTSEHLAPPERFFEEQEELYVNLKSMLITPPSTPTDEANHGLMQMEVLLFIAEACKKLGSGFRRRLAEERILEAIDQAYLTGESLALGEDIKSLLLTIGAQPSVFSGFDSAASHYSQSPGRKSSAAEGKTGEKMVLALQQGGRRGAEDVHTGAEEREEELLFDTTPTSPSGEEASPPSSPSSVSEHASLLFEGWKLPQISLSRADEKKLFEFQVRFGIRHDVASLVDSCRVLRKELIEDYPPEVFLQRPQIVRQLLCTVRMPRDVILARPSSQPRSAIPRPESVIIEALASLSSLSSRVLGSIRMHAQPALKPLPNAAAPTSHKFQSTIHPARYPAHPPFPQSVQSVALQMPESSCSLSVPGFIFLVIDTLLPLAAPVLSEEDSVPPSRIPGRAMAIIRLLLPFLRPPTSCASSQQRVLYLLSIMEPLLRSPLVPQHGPLVLLAMDLLREIDPSYLSPSELPEGMIKLYALLLPHHTWLESYMAILDPAALSTVRAAKGIIDKARPAASLLEFGRCPKFVPQPSSSSPALSWLHSALLRLDEALPLLAVIPDAMLVRLGVHLWARSLLPSDVSFLPQDDQEAGGRTQEGSEREELKDLATDVLLTLLSLSLDGNRRVAHQELVRLLSGEDTDASSNEAIVAAGFKPAPLKGHFVIQRLAHEAWLGPPGSKGALLRQLLEHGIHDPDAEIKITTWEGLRALSMMDTEDRLESLGCLLPLLIAARGQAYLDEGEEMEEGLGPGPRGLIIERIIQMVESSLPTSSQWILISLLLDLYTPAASPIRRGALRQLHGMLLTSGGQLPLSCTLSPDEAWAADVQVSAGGGKPSPPKSDYPSISGNTFTFDDLASLCDLLVGPSTLEQSVRLTAAQQLVAMLAARQPENGKFPVWIQEKVWNTAYYLLTSNVASMQETGSEVLVSAAWGMGEVPKLEALKRFIPFIYHASHTVRGGVLSALMHPVFVQQDYWSSSPTSTQSPQALSVSAVGNAMIHVAPSPRPRPPSSVLAFIPTVFQLPSSPGVPRSLVPLHIVPPCPPLPSLPLPDLIAVLLPLWGTSVTSISSPLSPLPPLVLPSGPTMEAASLVTSLRSASSLRSFSSGLQQLAQDAFSCHFFCEAFLKLEWMQALARLFQGPPATRRDEKLLQDTFLALGALVPFMGHRDRTILGAVSMECFLPILSPQQDRRVKDQDKAHGRNHKDDIVDDLLVFLTILCEADNGSTNLSSVLATRCPLASSLAQLIERQEPAVSSRTASLALHVLSLLLPPLATAGSAWPLNPKCLIRMAGRQHDPDSFAASGITRASLACLRTFVSLPWLEETNEIQGETSDMFSWGPESLLRFISDRQTSVRALCYGCLGQVLRVGGGHRIIGDASPSQDKSSPSLFETAMHVMADPAEAPAVAAEALGVVVGALLGAKRGGPSPNLTGSRVMAILNVVGESIDTITAPVGDHARLHAALEVLHTLLTVVDETRDEHQQGEEEVKGQEGCDNDIVDGPLLLRLIWQQGLVPGLVRVIAGSTLLHHNFIKASAAALGLPFKAGKTGEISSSAYFVRRSGGADSVKYDQKDRLLPLNEEAWTLAGEEISAAAQTEASRVLRILLQRNGGQRILKETVLADALAHCLEAHTSSLGKDSKDTPTGRTEDGGANIWETPNSAKVDDAFNKSPKALTKAQQILLAEACRTSHQVFRMMSAGDSPLPQSIISRILKAVPKALQFCEEEFLQNEALTLMTFLLSCSSSSPVWGEHDSQVPALCANLFKRFTSSYDEMFAVSFKKSPSIASNNQNGESAEARASLALALAALLQNEASFRQKALEARLIPFIIRRLRDLYGVVIIEGMDQRTDSSTETKGVNKKAKETGKKERRGLKQLNERLAGSGRGVARYTGEAIEITLLLMVLRAAVLNCPEAQHEADNEGLPGLAMKLWPYALRLELDDPFALTRQRLLDTRGGGGQRLYMAETLLEALLGCLCNAVAFNEEVKRSLILTTRSGKEADWPRAQDTLVHLVLRVALRPEVRPAIVDAAMGLIRSLALTSGGRKILIQAGFLTSPCGAVVTKALRGPGNRVARIQELSEGNVVRIFAVLRLMVNVTLASEGQKLLVAQVTGFSDLLEEVLSSVKESKASLVINQMEGGKDRDKQLVEELTVQICYLLRNLSFLRGSSKARVLASKPLLSFLVNSLAHPSLAVRLPASVAIWSLLYHSEKSLALLRDLPTQSKVEEAIKFLEKDEQGGDFDLLRKKKKGEDANDDSNVQNLASLRRALGSIRTLLACDQQE